MRYNGRMLAQAMVEYGALNSIASGFMQMYHRVEAFFTSGDSRYYFFLGLAAVIVLVLLRRR